MARRLLVVVAFALVVTACGGSSPSAPTVTTPPIANYAGVWDGLYTVVNCTQTGQMALVDLCSNIGGSPPYQMHLSQTGRTVSGSFRLGELQFPSTSGTVDDAGRLRLTAAHVENGVTIVSTFDLQITGTTIRGTLTSQWTSSGLTGTVTTTGNLITATRGAALLAPVQAPQGRTLEEMGRALLGR